MRGIAGAGPPVIVLCTLKVATQLFARVGAVTSVTVTPDWGFDTENVKLLMVMALGGTVPAIDTVVVVIGLPEQVLSFDAVTQYWFDAPGYSGYFVCAIG